MPAHFRTQHALVTFRCLYLTVMHYLCGDVRLSNAQKPPRGQVLAFYHLGYALETTLDLPEHPLPQCPLVVMAHPVTTFENCQSTRLIP